MSQCLVSHEAWSIRCRVRLETWGCVYKNLLISFLFPCSLLVFCRSSSAQARIKRFYPSARFEVLGSRLSCFVLGEGRGLLGIRVFIDLVSSQYSWFCYGNYIQRVQEIYGDIFVKYRVNEVVGGLGEKAECLVFLIQWSLSAWIAKSTFMQQGLNLNQT